MENFGKKRRRCADSVDGATYSKKLTTLPISRPAGLRVSASQLRELWQFDNECGSKYMKGCPLRTCSLEVEYNDSSGAGLTVEEMTLIKTSIKEMWQQAGTLFEIFLVKGEEHEGFRLRVRKDLAVKLVIKEQDAVPFGWLAEVPAEASALHIYNRSGVEPNGYLGGPISYMNWCSTNKQQISIQKSLNRNASHTCKLRAKGKLTAGTELRWDYGCKLYMPESGVWFQDECCRVTTVSPSDAKRHKLNEVYRRFLFLESCVLCGAPYTNCNKENRGQRKHHLVGQHADFLGSGWDGTGEYMQQIVDPNILLCNVDKLNYLLGALKRMNWNVLPACRVFTEEDLEFFNGDEEAIMDEFQRRCDLLKKGGTLVLRGTEFPSTQHHFKEIQPRPWKVINWKDKVKPPIGRYAIPSALKDVHESALPEFLSNFCEKYLQGN